MKTKKKFGMRRHIGITAAATLIALGATACEEAYWGDGNKKIHDEFLANFDTNIQDGKVNVVNQYARSDNDNCLNDGKGIDELKILFVSDAYSGDGNRFVIMCSEWSDGDKTYYLTNATHCNTVDNGSYVNGLSCLTLKDAEGNPPLDKDNNNVYQLCGLGNSAGRFVCKDIAYYCYSDTDKEYKKCDISNDLEKVLPDAFKASFNYRTCPKDYTFSSSWYLESSDHKMRNVCVKSVCGNKPVDLNSDNENCGGCGNKCSIKGSGYTCMNGKCVPADKSKVLCEGKFINPENDPNYCGASGDCNGVNAGSKCNGITPLCSGGKCVSTCVGGQIVCDGRCVDPQTDMNFCGATGNCKDENVGEKCTDGRFCSGALCATSCQEGLFLCEDKCVDGTTNPYYCGVTSDCTETSNGTKCEDTQVCVSGKCEYNSCKEPETLCSTTAGNRCINIQSDDADNCGSCGYKCSEHPVANATANGCANGVCQYTCINNTENVGSDNTAANIRCVDTSTDVKNCGRKGNECESGQVCVDSNCVQNSCTKPEILCSTEQGNTCIDVKGADVNNCGACGYKCADHPVANATANGCIKGVCQYNCINSTENVGSDNTAAKIRCADTSTDVNNCGRKGNKCESGKVCVDKKCVQNSCTKPEILCSTEQGNTCIDVKGDKADNCGACGYKCADHPVANATATGCVQGECQYKCNNSTENVGDGNTAEKIRCVDTSTDVNNCGRKGNKCESGQVCVNSKCVQNSCVAPLVLCSTTTGNQCININAIDENNCGACNYKCLDHVPQNASLRSGENQQCSSGKCQFNCYENYTCKGSGCSNDGLRCEGPNCFCECSGCIDNGTCMGLNEMQNAHMHANASKSCQCDVGYYLNGNECVSYDKDNCGAQGTQCQGNTPVCKTDEGKCVECLGADDCNKNGKGFCKTDNTCYYTECDDEYTLSENNASCVLKVKRCGSPATDCTEIENQTSVACENNFCVVKSCTGNTHVYNPTDGGVQTGHGMCEENTTENCGSHGNKCGVEDGTGQVAICEASTSTTSAQCKYSCAKDFTDCSSASTSSETENASLICLKKDWRKVELTKDECKSCVNGGCKTGETCKRTGTYGYYSYSCE